MVASAYSGDNQYCPASLRQTALTAIRISTSVVTLIRIIANIEDSELCLSNSRMNRMGANR